MKLGIMGGTFDPIHKGHLHMARAALDEENLDGVLFLPDGDPPHKKPCAAPEQRMRMVRLAIQDEKRFMASDMEIRRTGTTYTVDTLLALGGGQDGKALYYIIGSDTLFQIPTWHTVQKVAEMCTLLVVMRGSDLEEDVRREQARLLAALGVRSRLLQTCGLPVSSSMIREKLRLGESVQDFLTEDVRRYITERGLYRV